VCGGAQAGDQVLGFGAVAGGGGNALRQVAQLVQARAPTLLPWTPSRRLRPGSSQASRAGCLIQKPPCWLPEIHWAYSLDAAFTLSEFF